MSMTERIEVAIRKALTDARSGPIPPKLSQALDYAVHPGGARVRPTICLSVARACAEDDPALSDAAAAALELIHCASLVHDDLPCFDDADLRRGKPALHRAFGEPLAVLTGDSLIAHAFDVLAKASIGNPERGLQMVSILSAATGPRGGICAGQAWESEDQIDLSAYHQSKTGSLFVAATRLGAAAAGADPEPWTELGARIGEAFQVADDLRDALFDKKTMGKPAGQDEAHGRPNAVTELGVRGAVDRLENILSGAISSIPSCPGEAALCEMVRAQAERLNPVIPVRERS